MYVAAALGVKRRLVPAVDALRAAISEKSEAWKDIIKIGRTHMQDATPLTLGQEWSGYAGMLADDLERIEVALQGVFRLALGGTAVPEPSTIVFLAIAIACGAMALAARRRWSRSR